MRSLFNRAIVRPPAANFGEGLTTSGLGPPDHATALAQHAAYCRALESCGLELARLAPDPAHPDSTFVEDTAVVWERNGILARPGAASRRGEVTEIGRALKRFLPALAQVAPPGTLDGGDVCETDGLVLIGISSRTNDEGARQLAVALAHDGIESAAIDARAIPGLLHLKSGLSWLGDGRVAVVEAMSAHPALARFERVVVDRDEQYAANCVRVNDRVLVVASFPRFEAALLQKGYAPLPLEMSEFRKMDGGLSCLSLRFVTP